MSDSNPFAQPKPPPAAARSADTRLAWWVAGILGVLAVGFGILWAVALANQEDIELLKAKLKAAQNSFADARADNQKDADQITELQAKLSGLEQEKAATGQAAKSLEDEMRQELQSKDVTISKLQGKLTVSILDRVMFDSGEAVLKPGGQSVMRQIAGILAEHPTLKIHVIGHTDNVPIHTARFASNWELSVARALAAVHFLTEKAGVDARRVGAVGYGEFRPIADNATAEGRAKNRRIAITILPDELAGADTTTPAAAAGNTNAPPVMEAPVAPVAPITPLPPVAPVLPPIPVSPDAPILPLPPVNNP